MKSFKQWLREHGLRMTLLGVAWICCMFFAVLAVVFGWKHLDVLLTGQYLPKKQITAAANLLMFYVPLILFNFAFGNPLHEIFKRKNAIEEDRWDATIFLSVTAMCTAYLVSIGA
jgi:hypothetical protein